MWWLVALIIVSIMIGIYTQKAKGRNGAFWGLLTFGLGVVWLVFSFFALIMARVRYPEFTADLLTYKVTYAVFAGVPVLVVMGLIALTLPNLKARPDQRNLGDRREPGVKSDPDEGRRNPTVGKD